MSVIQQVHMSDVSIENEFNESAFNYQTCNGWKDIERRIQTHSLYEGLHEAQFIDDEDMTLPHVHTFQH